MNESKLTADRPTPPSRHWRDVEALEELLSRPDQRCRRRSRRPRWRHHRARRQRQDGADAGAHGQARRARQAVYAVARFRCIRRGLKLQSHGVETIEADLLDPDAVGRLPEAKNVVLMAGFKFGAAHAPSRTWATNTLLAAQVAGSLTTAASSRSRPAASIRSCRSPAAAPPRTIR